jgi:hypothetical protein
VEGSERSANFAGNDGDKPAQQEQMSVDQIESRSTK